MLERSAEKSYLVPEAIPEDLMAQLLGIKQVCSDSRRDEFNSVSSPNCRWQKWGQVVGVPGGWNLTELSDGQEQG